MVADDGPKKTGLADAIATQDTGDLALFDVEGHATHRLRGAVVEGGILDGKHAHLPR